MNNNQKYDKEIADLKEQLASSADELTVWFLWEWCKEIEIKGESESMLLDNWEIRSSIEREREWNSFIIGSSFSYAFGWRTNWIEAVAEKNSFEERIQQLEEAAQQSADKAQNVQTVYRRMITINI